MACHIVSSFLACAILCHCLVTPVTSDIMKLRFPYRADNDLFPRVKIEASFKSLTSFTLCLWAKPSFDGREMTAFSYGVPGQDKEISLSLKDRILRLYVGGSPLLDAKCDDEIKVDLVSGAWHHICVTWTNVKSSAKSFVNGVYCSKSSSEYSAHIMPGSGVMVLGQALKGLDTGFHKDKSWNGDIAGVQMWDEILNYQQIVNHGKCKGNLEGNVVSWMKTPMVASDQVIISSTDTCDELQKFND